MIVLTPSQLCTRIVLSAKQALKAVAQVIEDYPERWTQGWFARDKHKNRVAHNSSNAVCFCAMGMLERLVYEGTITGETESLARYLFQTKHVYGLAGANDNLEREQLVKMLREAAK